MMVLGKLMKEASWLVKGITFDSAHSHRYIKEALFGAFSSLKQESLADLEWWQELTYEELPAHCMPRLPLKLVRHAGETLHCLPGVCFLALMAQFKLYKN